MKPKVLYAVLNWGLGHASRSIPIIKALQINGIEPLIVSDGQAFSLLSQSFPELQCIKLPSLNINYKSNNNQRLAILEQAPHLLSWFNADRTALKKLIKEHKPIGIISDNRPAIYSKEIPSVYITHQVNIKAGIASPIATLLHKKVMGRFHEIWIPDTSESPGLAGDLSHGHELINFKYLGPLSDLSTNTETEKQFDIGLLLSGPEPQRSLFEQQLIDQLAESDQSIWLIRGTESERPMNMPTNWRVDDLADRNTIKKAFGSCDVIVARNGYSTLMDLYHYPKPALLVPTPGQPEQEYLSTLQTHLQKFAIQHQNKLDIISGIAEARKRFKGTKPEETKVNWPELFSLFQGE